MEMLQLRGPVDASYSPVGLGAVGPDCAPRIGENGFRAGPAIHAARSGVALDFAGGCRRHVELGDGRGGGNKDDENGRNCAAPFRAPSFRDNSRRARVLASGRPTCSRERIGSERSKIRPVRRRRVSVATWEAARRGCTNPPQNNSYCGSPPADCGVPERLSRAIRRPNQKENSDGVPRRSRASAAPVPSPGYQTCASGIIRYGNECSSASRRARRREGRLERVDRRRGAGVPLGRGALAEPQRLVVVPWPWPFP
jgi:hypothetical protein